MNSVLILLFAAVPLRWTVETSRVQPVQFDAIRGETLSLEAAFNSYGTALQLGGESGENGESGFSLFYQTNGMGSAWWRIPATVASNRVSAVFAPTNDPGAGAVKCFLGATGSIYRAAFTLRFRDGPGATPNALAAPVPVLDLANTTVVNPPWPTTNDFQTATNSMQAALKDYVDSEISGAGVVTPTAVTNIVDDKIAAIPKDGVSTNAVSGIITNHVTSGYLCTVEKATQLAEEAESIAENIAQKSYIYIAWAKSNTSYFYGRAHYSSMLTCGTGTPENEVSSIQYSNNRWRVTSPDSQSTYTGEIALTKDIPNITTLSNNVTTLSTQVNNWENYWSGATNVTYDFAGGTNFTLRIYAALTNLINHLGGSVTNAPTFNQ